MFDQLSAIVLAAGRGTRMNAKKINKVMFELGGRPMIGYTVDLLQKVGLTKIIIVVGYLHKTVIDYLGNNFIYAYQKKRLGTGHAVLVALKKLPVNTNHVLVVNADDSAFYPPKVLNDLISQHLATRADLTFLTVDKKKPNIARVIRDSQGKILGVVEQQNLKPEQEKIKEINCGCYCFSVNFLKHFLPKLEKNPLSQEYYITQLIELGIHFKRKIKAYKMEKAQYFYGVNTRNQLIAAEKRMRQKITKNG